MFLDGKPASATHRPKAAAGLGPSSQRCSMCPCRDGQARVVAIAGVRSQRLLVMAPAGKQSSCHAGSAVLVGTALAGTSIDVAPHPPGAASQGRPGDVLLSSHPTLKSLIARTAACTAMPPSPQCQRARPAAARGAAPGPGCSGGGAQSSRCEGEGLQLEPVGANTGDSTPPQITQAGKAAQAIHADLGSEMRLTARGAG